MSKRTEGPWRINGTTRPFISGGTGPNGPVFIAEIEHATAPARYKFSAPGEAAEANARLIAAAPDLLEALILLENALDQPDTPSREGLIAMRRAEARAAIAKARGEEQP